MKHTIYISVAEYLANGGKLVNNQIIYSQKEKNEYVQTGWYDMFDQTNPDMIRISKRDRSFSINNEFAFVEVNVKPIYEPIVD